MTWPCWMTGMILRPCQPSSTRACNVWHGRPPSTPTMELPYEPTAFPPPPEFVYRARPCQTPGRIVHEEGGIQVLHRGCGIGVLALARCRRQARGSHGKTAGSPVPPVRKTGAGSEHPDRDSGAVCALLPDGEHAAAGVTSGGGKGPGPGALRAIRRAVGPPHFAWPQFGARGL